MATQLTMELARDEDLGSMPEAIRPRLADGSGAEAAQAAVEATDGVTTPVAERELVSRGELKKRIVCTGVTAAWLIGLGLFDLEQDEHGHEKVVWIVGTVRQSLLDRFVAMRGVPRDAEAFEAYRSVFKGLDRGVTHAPEVLEAAREFLLAEGITPAPVEMGGLIGGYLICQLWLRERKRGSGQFVEQRYATGSAYVKPVEDLDDVLERLALGKHVPEGTLGDPRLRDPIFEPTGYQCRNLMLIENEQLFRAVAMYLLVKMVDDVLPATVDRIIQVASRADMVLRDVDLTDARQVTERLEEYVVDRAILTDDTDGIRATTVYLLYSIYETVGDWCDLLPAKEREFFRTFEIALPRRSSRIIKLLAGLDAKRLKARLSNRKGRSDRLVAGFDLSRLLVDVRYHQVRRMHEAYRVVRDRLAAMSPEEREASLPFDFWYVEHVPACLDEPAVDQLVRLRVTSRARIITGLAFADDGAILDYDMRSRARGGKQYDPETEVDWILEYVDTVALDGGTARPLWLVDIVRTNFFMNPVVLTAADGTRRRAAMRELHMGPSHAERAGLFIGWGGRDGNSVLYKAMSRQGRTFLPIENLYMATAMGRISVRITTTNGARPSELLQLQIDPERWGEIFDEANRVDVTYFEAVPKMKDDWFVFFIDEDTRKAIEELIDFLSDRYYGGGNLPVIPPALCLYSKRLHGEKLPDAAYILSWRGLALDHVEFSICQRLLMHGFGDFLPYDARHAFATVARAENMPSDVLQKIMHHERAVDTAMYSDPTAQEKAQHFTAFAGRRHTVANLLALGEALDGADAAAFDRIGGLGRTPCGHCLNPQPCGDRTACVGCFSNRSDPAYRDEALRQLAHAERRLTDAEAEGFVKFAEQARSDVEDVKAVLREMDLMELARADGETHPEVVSGVPEMTDA